MQNGNNFAPTDIIALNGLTNFLNYKDLEELPLNADCIFGRRQGFVSGVCAGSADCLGSP